MEKNKKDIIAYPAASVDFVIIASLDEEREAMLSKLKGFKKLDKESEDIYTYYFAQVKSQRKDGAIYQIIVVSPLNMGPLNAAALTVTLVNRWKPQFVILTGIACGVKGEVNYGDVMIATQVADYSLAKQIDGERKVRWEVTPSGASLIDSANNIDSKWVNQIKHTRPIPGIVEKIKGVIASGGDVISDDDVIKLYSENWPKLIGIEMESGGVASGINQTVERPEFLMVKSVSDFGKDKHNPEVKPWRKYACHTAAAFVFGLIKSGPFQSSLLLKNKSKNKETQDKKRETAERYWLYIQNHPIIRIELLLLLKSAVGYNWLVDVLGDVNISFSEEKKGLTLKEVLKNSHLPNKTKADRKSNLPTTSFWELYGLEEGYWCKRIKSDGHKVEMVAGFEANIPWGYFNLSNIINLSDLATCNSIEVNFPPKLFHAGLEEVILRIHGETFSFSIYASDNFGLEANHYIVSSFHGFAMNEPLAINLITVIRYQGIQLLEMFHKQSMPEFKENNNKDVFGLSPISLETGNSISFYPSIPNGFHDSKEALSLLITLPGGETIDYDAIELELKNDIKKNKGTVESFIKLGELFIIQRRFQEAIKLFLSAPNKIKLNSDYFYILGFSYSNLGRIEEALECFQQGIILNNDDAKLFINIGCLYEVMNDMDKALANIRRAVELNPYDAQYQFRLSRILALLGNISKAIIHAKAAMEISPNDEDIIINYGYLLASNCQYVESIINFEKAIELNPKSYEAYKYNAKALVIIGELEKAAENYKKSIELKEDLECYGGLSEILCNSEIFNFAEVEEIILKGLKIEPNSTTLLLYLGILKAKYNKFDEAIQNYELVIFINPNKYEAFHNLANVYSMKNDFQKAIENYRKAIELNKNIQSYLSLINLLCKLELWNETELAILEALTYVPENYELLNYLGIAKASKGEVHEAIKIFKRSIKLNSTNNNALELIKFTKKHYGQNKIK